MSSFGTRLIVTSASMNPLSWFTQRRVKVSVFLTTMECSPSRPTSRIGKIAALSKEHSTAPCTRHENVTSSSPWISVGVAPKCTIRRGVPTSTRSTPPPAADSEYRRAGESDIARMDRWERDAAFVRARFCIESFDIQPHRSGLGQRRRRCRECRNPGTLRRRCPFRNDGFTLLARRADRRGGVAKRDGTRVIQRQGTSFHHHPAVAWRFCTSQYRDRLGQPVNADAYNGRTKACCRSCTEDQYVAIDGNLMPHETTRLGTDNDFFQRWSPAPIIGSIDIHRPGLEFPVDGGVRRINRHKVLVEAYGFPEKFRADCR
jgi:hypothetical protein